ncbi:MAG: hypothetical protein C0518_02710 [Opitutus sp.]|nr:hypothetical protein [Opitutus sp.]
MLAHLWLIDDDGRRKMKTPSRKMPPLPATKKPTALSWIVTAVILAPLAWFAFANPPVRWTLLGCGALLAVLSLFHRRWLKRLRKERKEESICTFSRALPAKDHDTWVVRAAYEEISHHAGAPIRPSDDVVKFWGIDGDDLDDAILRIARRARRSMSDVQKNPLCGRVVTVADVIAFVEHQPREPIQGITDNSGAAPLRV